MFIFLFFYNIIKIDTVVLISGIYGLFLHGLFPVFRVFRAFMRLCPIFTAFRACIGFICLYIIIWGFSVLDHVIFCGCLPAVLSVFRSVRMSVCPCVVRLVQFPGMCPSVRSAAVPHPIIYFLKFGIVWNIESLYFRF